MRLRPVILLPVLLAVLLLPTGHPHAEPFIAGAALDQGMVADVTAAALTFMGPRTLEPIPLSQLSLWGLRGLATIDPRLTPELREGELRLSLFADPAPHLLLARRVPDGPDGAAWGSLVADLVRAAWDVSQSVRQAGTDGVLEVFFDEICNHLDPYSRYATPGEAEPDRDLRAAVGLDAVARRGGYVVGRVLADGPAAMAGVRSGETLLSIDGQTLADATAADVAALLAGPEDSTVVIRLRGWAGRERDVALTRVVHYPQTVRARWVGRLLVLQVSSFAPDTGARLARALAVLGREPPPPPGGGVAKAAARAGGRSGARGVVIDLRGNRGGLLRQAVAAAETLLSDGIIAVTVGRDPAANHEFSSEGQDLANGLPVVVLVDGSSASAAEILAAALADQHRAVVVGSSTLGKGLVQAVERLPNGGDLVLTWSRVLAPLGWPIQGLGVLPQVCTSLGEDAMGVQLAELDHGDQPMGEILARHRGIRPPVPSAELLEVRAACPASEGRDGDLTAARFLVDHPTAYTTALLGPPVSYVSPGASPPAAVP